MRLITGDECGLIKETIPEVGRPPKQNVGPTNATSLPITIDKGITRIHDGMGVQKRSRGVVGMCWMEKQFAALRVDGTIDIFQPTYESKKKAGSYELEQTIEHVFDSGALARPLLSLSYAKERLVAADSTGRVSVMNPSKAKVIAQYSAFEKTKQGSNISYTKGQYVNNHVATTMTTSSEGNIAISGRERETTILAIDGGAQIWKAKNLPPDAQTLLQQPVWSTALTFLSPNLLLAGTAYQQVRLYDIRSHSRRPVSYTPEGLLEHRVTALCGLSENAYVVGDAAGFLNEVDLRSVMGKTKKSSIHSLPRYVGPGGSIRQIVRHKTRPILACVGLDRMLRTYKLSTRKQLDCVYMKQRLNSVLFCDDEEFTDDANVEDYTGDDGDIDAEDRVQDYVDSDLEGAEGDESQSSGESEESEEDRDDDDDDKDNDEDAESEDSDDAGASDDDLDSDDDSSDGKDDPFVSRSTKKQRR